MFTELDRKYQGLVNSSKGTWYQGDSSEGVFYYREIGERVYEFISTEWLDTTDNDTHPKNSTDNRDVWAICTDIVDLKGMSLKDIEFAILDTYSSIEEMERDTGSPLGRLDFEIAEMEYRSHHISDGTSIGGVYTDKQAKEKIVEYMLAN